MNYVKHAKNRDDLSALQSTKTATVYNNIAVPLKLLGYKEAEVKTE